MCAQLYSYFCFIPSYRQGQTLLDMKLWLQLEIESVKTTST